MADRARRGFADSGIESPVAWKLGIAFPSLEEARTITERWLQMYNRVRPHEALEGLPPCQFATQFQPEGLSL